MSVWDTYPSDYRKEEVQAIRKAIAGGECVSLVGLSGAGKSNLMGFLAHRAAAKTKLIPVDCNSLPAPDAASLYNALIEGLGGSPLPQPDLRAVYRLVDAFLRENPAGVCFLLDRFDLFNAPIAQANAVAGNLRSLRDRFKYSLTYVVATRKPLEPASELAELFSANVLWLGPLNQADAVWSIAQYAGRHGVAWDDETVERIFALSGGYPSMLRAVCEAFRSGSALEQAALLNSGAVQRRVDEFWSDAPLDRYLRESHLENHPLLCAGAPVQVDAATLTATEQRLLEYFSAHPEQICEKSALIEAAWPDEKVAAGLRDDSLAQLVHRLREKIDTPGKKHIQTIAGRGYRYRP